MSGDLFSVVHVSGICLDSSQSAHFHFSLSIDILTQILHHLSFKNNFNIHLHIINSLFRITILAKDWLYWPTDFSIQL